MIITNSALNVNVPNLQYRKSRFPGKYLSVKHMNC